MITSAQNEQVKRVRALQKKREARQDSGRFVIEGLRLIDEALKAGAALEEIYFTEAFAATPDGERLATLASKSARAQTVSEAVMRTMAETVTPQGVLAVTPIPALAWPKPLTFALVLDAISDPANMGTILRTAAGAGVPAALVMPGSVDVHSPKVVRGAMGAHFRLPIRVAGWGDLRGALGELPALLAESGGGVPYFQVDWTRPCALIVSNEANGPSPEAIRVADQRVTIPMPGGIESLNVAVATGTLLFEMARQRSLSKENPR